MYKVQFPLNATDATQDLCVLFFEETDGGDASTQATNARNAADASDATAKTQGWKGDVYFCIASVAWHISLILLLTVL